MIEFNGPALARDKGTCTPGKTFKIPIGSCLDTVFGFGLRKENMYSITCNLSDPCVIFIILARKSLLMDFMISSDGTASMSFAIDGMDANNEPQVVSFNFKSLKGHVYGTRSKLSERADFR